MEVEEEVSRWEGYADWRNRAAVKGRHGGMLAASFVLVVEILENLAYLANASNLVLYLREYMHMSPSKSANDVTNFMGTAFLLALLGGFLSDAFFSTFQIFLISASIEFLGLIILTIQARTPSLMPPSCDSPTCEEVSGSKAAMLFVGLYLVALGVGGIKGSLASHGAEQFDESTPKGRKQRSTFFNYFVFCLACGALVAVTFVVWLEDNKGWEWGFGVSTIAIFVSILIFLSGSRFYRNKIPCGSPLTTILKVLLAASVKCCSSGSSSNAVASMSVSPSNHCVSKGKKEVESQGELEKPRQEEALPPRAQLTNSLKGVAKDSGLLDSKETLPVTFLWIALQYLFLGSADLFTLAGLLEYFFTEAPSSMRSLATSLSWASLAMGYYLSSVIVSIVNSITGSSGNTPWLRGKSINRYKLDYFYWLMCVLSAANFLHYLFWAMRYKYRSTGSRS
ncbi:unnamed protein product [Arabidopsis thaliana]|uniref:(thale cress) hypothetical protein n=1 Tax=Arabidopsis thaliana TaxID=3702 RepID=A0A7G2E7S8_ARATH|nr:unnamed protein product [Arabidopsis thaliana]